MSRRNGAYKGKRQSKKQKYVPDVIQSYAHKRHKQVARPAHFYTMYPPASAEDIHLIAEQVFGQTGYISFESLTK